MPWGKDTGTDFAKIIEGQLPMTLDQVAVQNGFTSYEDCKSCYEAFIKLGTDASVQRFELCEALVLEHELNFWTEIF